MASEQIPHLDILRDSNTNSYLLFYLSPRPPICLPGAAAWGLSQMLNVGESVDLPVHRERIPSTAEFLVLKPFLLPPWPVTRLRRLVRAGKPRPDPTPTQMQED